MQVCTNCQLCILFRADTIINVLAMSTERQKEEQEKGEGEGNKGDEKKKKTHIHSWRGE